MHTDPFPTTYDDPPPVIYQVKLGVFGHGWHATHLTFAFLSSGLWLIVYAMHGIVWSLGRATTAVTVPYGHRIEWRYGHPNVLGPEEWLEKQSAAARFKDLSIYLVPALVAVIGCALLLTSASGN